jgi:hypothetical protein
MTPSTIARGGVLTLGCACVAAIGVAGLHDDSPRDSVFHQDTWMLFLLSALVVGGAALVARYGFPERPRDLRGAAARVVSGIGCGGILGALLITPGILWVGSDWRALYLSAAATVLVVLFMAIAPRRILGLGASELTSEIALPRRLPALPDPHARYTLTGGGPAVTAEESECAARAVEVRVSWGDTLLEVHHLEPPRAFLVGGVGADLAIDLEESRFPGGRVAVVLVSPDGVRVVTQSFGDGDRIPLKLGAPVTITLPCPSGLSPYRAANATTDAEHVPVTLEVALIRAGRAVGREPSPAPWRFLASLAAATAIVAAPLALGASWARPLDPDEGIDGSTRDEILHITRLLQSSDERAALAEDELEVAADNGGPMSGHGVPDWIRQRTRYSPSQTTFALYDNRWDDEWWLGEPERWPRMDLTAPWPCAVTPFGRQRADGEPTEPGMPWCGDTDPWFDCSPFTVLAYDRRCSMRPYASLPGPSVPERPSPRLDIATAAVDVGTPRVTRGALPVPAALRVMKQLPGRLRACYQQAIEDSRGGPIAGEVDVELLVGDDGAVRRATINRATVSNPDLFACARRTLERVPFPAPASPSVVTIPLVFRLAAGVRAN